MIAYLKLFRLPFVFTAMADSAAGYLVASRAGRYGWGWETLALVALSSAGLYAFGMALNDIVDVERDRVSAPGRVLPSGRISRRAAWVAALGALVVSGAAIAAVSRVTLLIWAPLVFCIVAYDTFLKVAPIMGLVRVLNFALGVSYVTSVERRFIPACMIALFIYATALTFASRQEEGKACRWIVVVCGVLMGAAALGAALAGARFLGDRGSCSGLVPAALLAVWLLFRAFVARDRDHVKLLVRDGVGGILLLDAAMLMSAGLIPAGLVVAAMIVPAALGVMVLRRV